MKKIFAMNIKVIHFLMGIAVIGVIYGVETGVTKMRKCVEITLACLGLGKLAVTDVSENILYVMELLTVKMDQMKRIVKCTFVLKVMLNVEI